MTKIYKNIHNPYNSDSLLIGVGEFVQAVLIMTACNVLAAFIVFRVLP